jgi:hypothetical protein
MSRLEQLGDELFGHILKPCSTVLYDMDCLQDFKLGALLCMIQEEYEYDYIISRLPIYDQALDTNVMEYFPDLTYTDEMIENYIKDPENSKKLAFSSPMTSIYTEMQATLHGLEISNHKCPNWDGAISLIFYTIDLSLIRPNLNNFIDHLKEIYGYKPNEFNDKIIFSDNDVITIQVLQNLKLTLMQGELTKEKKYFFNDNDMYFIRDIGKFFRDSNISKMVMEEGILFDKEVYANLTVDKDKQNKSEKEITDMLDATIKAFNLLCNFKFIGKETLIEKSEEELNPIMN